MLYRNRKSMITVAFLMALSICTPLAGAKPKPLNRSIYVPVHFRLCEHLKNGVLYIGEQAVARLPAERVFQFTYYPSLDRVAPEVVQVRIEAFDQEGNAIVARMAVTTHSITTAHERVDFDFAKHLKRLSYKIDTHYDKVDLLIRCGQTCGVGGGSEEDVQTPEGDALRPGHRFGEKNEQK